MTLNIRRQLAVISALFLVGALYPNSGDRLSAHAVAIGNACCYGLCLLAALLALIG